MSELTKVSIVLACPSDWWLWIKHIKDLATARSIWTYIDPDGTTPEPSAPEKPKYQDLGADSIRQIVDSQQSDLWKELKREYSFEFAEYERVSNHLIAIRTFISTTIPAHYWLGFDSDASLRDIIRSLRTSFKPDMQTRIKSLDKKFNSLTMPNRGKAIDKWFAEWKEFVVEALNVPEYNVSKFNTVVRFHEAVYQLMPMYTTIRQEAFKDIEPERINLLDEIYRFEQRYALERIDTPKYSVFGTFQGRAEGNGLNNSKSQSNQRTDKRNDCLCGDQHRFRKCPYVNPAVRPHGWAPLPAIQARFDGPKHAAVQKALDGARREIANARQPQLQQSQQPQPQRSPPPAQVDHFNLHCSLALPTKKEIYELHDSWIADTGSDTHVANDLSRFIELEDAPDDHRLRFGNALTPIVGYGKVSVKGTRPDGNVTLTLSDVAYVPGLHTNIVSMKKAEKAGIFFSARFGCLEDINGCMVCELHSVCSQYVIEYNPLHVSDSYDAGDIDGEIISPATSFAPPPNTFSTEKSVKKSELPPHSTAEAELWHARMAHASTAAIDHLTIATEGVSLPPCRHTNVSSRCETCRLAKAQRQISRRLVPPAQHPWEKVYFDFLNIKPTAYNGDRFCLHFVCSATNWHIAIPMPNKDQIRVVRVFRNLINWAKTQLNATIKLFFSDNDVSLGLDFRLLAEDFGVEIQDSARYADSQHGKPERAGGLLTTRMRSMLITARLPEALWPDAIVTAVYLLNRTPTWTTATDGSHVWTTPHERMLGKKPNIANLRVFGCRAYIRDPKVPQGRKGASRGWIGYLVGYSASNIWRIWNPRRREVVEERDVTFNESLFYDPDLPLPEDIPVNLPPPAVETLQLPPAIREADAQPVPDPLEDRFSDDEDSPTQGKTRFSITKEQTITPENQPSSTEHNQPDLDRTLTPELTPLPDSPKIPGAFDSSLPSTPPQTQNSPTLDPFFIPSPEEVAPWVEELSDTHNFPDERPDSATRQLSAELESSSDSPVAAGGGESQPTRSVTPPHRQQRYQNTASRANEISSDIDPNLVMTGRRKRKRVYHDAFPLCHGFSIAWSKASTLSNLAAAVSTSPSSATVPSEVRIHRNDLPDPPSGYRGVLKHPLKYLFLSAMDIEERSLVDKNTWTITDRPDNAHVIPTIWVFTYKFDDEGFLKRAKARLCVQGNKQIMTHAETRAATLAARCFRTLMSLVAAFGLEMQQFDAINAFVNSLLDEIVYVEIPPGRSNPDGKVLRLLRALYGLRRSPRLWQLELTRTLREIGLEPVNEEPCLFTGKGVILMVYVDDIILAYHPDHHHDARSVADLLKERYELRYEGEGDVFLGIKIIRDRANQVVHLSNTDYIRKIVSRFHLEDRFAPTPAIKTYSPYQGTATLAEVRHYQQKIGSINYAAIATRPDVAKIASHLATFMTNPGPDHFEAANRVIAYLNYTQKVGIRYSASAPLPKQYAQCFMTASDAAFADLPGRQSSEGYLATLYNGPIDWRASKQKTVTTSSTEAEFLAISEAGKTLQWWKRLFAALNFSPEHDLSIKCDNMQTVRILCKDDVAIQTKLRHVDIRQHWLRQETQMNRILIDWIPTSQMPADGLTKVLTGQRFHNFIRLLGLTEFA